MIWNERPSGAIWDIRPSGLKDERAVWPTTKCIVLNAQNERISNVFYVDFDTGKVGRWKSSLTPWGVETFKVNVELHSDGTEKRTLEEEWLNVPGVKIIPFTPEMELAQAEEVKAKKKKWKAELDGKLIEQK